MTTLLYLDSRDRVQGFHPGECVWHLANPFRARTVSLKPIMLPHAFYTMAANDTFTITPAGAAAATTIVPAPGLYTLTTLAAMLQAQIRATLAGAATFTVSGAFRSGKRAHDHVWE